MLTSSPRRPAGEQKWAPGIAVAAAAALVVPWTVGLAVGVLAVWNVLTARFEPMHVLLTVGTVLTCLYVLLDELGNVRDRRRWARAGVRSMTGPHTSEATSLRLGRPAPASPPPGDSRWGGGHHFDQPGGAR